MFNQLAVSVMVILVHRQARLRDTINNYSSIGVRRDEAIEIGLSQNQQPTITQGDYVRLPPASGQQSHFAKKLAASKPYAPRRQPDLDRTRSDKKDRVTAPPVADDPLVGYRKPRP